MIAVSAQSFLRLTAQLMFGLLAFLPSTDARAMEVCEASKPTATFQVIGFSATKKELAVRRADDVCDEVATGGAVDEQWRKLRYVTIHDGEGAVVHAFVEGSSDDRKRLLQARSAEVRDSVLAPGGQLNSYLKAGRFQPLPARSTSENGACSVRFLGHKANGASNVRIEVRAGDETLAMLRLVGEARKQYDAKVYFVQLAQLVAIYAALPQRYGAPQAEIERTPTLTFLPISKYPKLTRCFQAAESPPAATPAAPAAPATPATAAPAPTPAEL